MRSHLVYLFMLAATVLAGATQAAEPAPKLVPGKTVTVQFPEMPPTFYAIFQKQDVKAQMTIYLPTNYDPAKKYPLFVYLNGWDGGAGDTLGVVRSVTKGRDFVCVSMPLFKAAGFKVEKANAPGKDFIMIAEDGKYMWPFFKTMLTKVEELVPNIDTTHRILGGFSNGAHATAALIESSDGEVSRLFCAFVVVEGGGKMKHFELLKEKFYLMLSSNAKSRPRAQQICDAAKAAGAKTTFIFHDVGKHDFPVAAYPTVGEWLHNTVLAAPAASKQ